MTQKSFWRGLCGGKTRVQRDRKSSETERQVPLTNTDGDRFIGVQMPWTRNYSQNKPVLSANVNSFIFFNTLLGPYINNFMNNTYVHTHWHSSTAEKDH